LVEQPHSFQCELRAGHPGDHANYTEHLRWRANPLIEYSETLWRRQRI
jgi:hypothetical protein